MPTSKQTKEIQAELNRLDQQISSAKRLQEIMLEEGRPIYSVYKWKAPDRVHDPKEKNWYIAVAALAMVVIVYSALVFNWLLIITVIALLLLIYAVNTIPPKEIELEITNKGLNLFNQLIPWRDIKTFWISQRGNHNLINFEIQSNKDPNPRRVIVLQGQGDITKIVTYLVDHVDYLSEDAAGTGFISTMLEGRYMPLIQFLDQKKVQAKPAAKVVESKTS